MQSDYVHQMGDNEIINVMQRICGPLFAELARRGYEVQLKPTNTAGDTPLFTLRRQLATITAPN